MKCYNHKLRGQCHCKTGLPNSIQVMLEQLLHQKRFWNYLAQIIHHKHHMPYIRTNSQTFFFLWQHWYVLLVWELMPCYYCISYSIIEHLRFLPDWQQITSPLFLEKRFTWNYYYWQSDFVLNWYSKCLIGGHLVLKENIFWWNHVVTN